jgi:hypothetical protein
MLVVMPVVLGVPAAVVDVVHVVAVRYCDVPTAFAVGVIMPLVGGVLGRLALVEVSLVRLM